MDDIIIILLPFVLLLARVGAFLAAAPVFGSPSVPMIVKAGLAIWVSIFLAVLVPPSAQILTVHWLRGSLMMAQEIAIGLALGLGARLIFLAIQQGGSLMAQQMGMTDASVIDPSSGEETESLASFMEMAVTVAFLVMGGHQLLLMLLTGSYSAFPLGSLPEIGSLTSGLVAAGSTMLLFAIKMAAPLMAAFLVLAIVLAVLARALPEMNILFESYPLRVALGLLMTAAIMPSLADFTAELAGLMKHFLPT